MPTSPLRELLQNSQFVGAALGSPQETFFLQTYSIVNDKENRRQLWQVKEKNFF